MWTGKVGSNRIVRRLVGDVNLSAISELEPGFKIFQAETVSIGGDAPKSFIEFHGGRDLFGHAYIAKGSRKQGPRECVTEYLISRVAGGLPVRMARSRLVIVPGRALADPDVRFMSRYFLNTGRREILTHGLELVATAFGMDERAIQTEVPRNPTNNSRRRFVSLEENVSWKSTPAIPAR